MRNEDLFKSIGTMDDNLIERSEKKETRRWHKGRWGIAITACFCICILWIVIRYPDTTKQPKPPAADNSIENTEENNVTSNIEETKSNEQLQERIKELQDGDSLGWIVIDDKRYIQSQDKELGSEENYNYIGKAGDFIGYYQNEESCDGEVYSYNDDRKVIFIKLDNGGIVFLDEDTESVNPNESINESSDQETNY